MRGDLHVHSTASDGLLSPSALVDRAIERGLDVLAIADHDSIEGVDEAIEASRHTSLILIPAVELSTVYDGRDIHILGLFIDHRNDVLREYLHSVRTRRLERAERIIEALTAAGYRIGIDEVAAFGDEGSVGRSHIARALVASGQVEDFATAFGELIGRGQPFFVAREVPDPETVIGVIRGAGGLATLAHPGIGEQEPVLPRLVRAGLGAVEAYHSEHSAEQRCRYARLAAEHGLLVTGGSDFHGDSMPNPDIGSVDLPPAHLEAVLAWGTEHRPGFASG